MAISMILAAVLSLDGLWDFSFNENKTLECVQMPAFEANAISSQIGGVDGARTRNPRIDSPVR